MDQAPIFKPVPLQPVLQAATKHHLNAIYRRQQRTTGPYDEEIIVTGPDGLPKWDLTTPLPVSRHADWMKKGFEYITLADMASLEKVAPYLREAQLNPLEFRQHPHFGPWNPKLYAATAAEGDRAAVVKLFEMLDKHGVETYEEITGQKVSGPLLAAWQKHREPATAVTSTVVSGGATTVIAPAQNLLDRAAAKVTRTKPAGKGKAAKVTPTPAAVDGADA